jgi:hypothetical protein
MSIMPRLLVLLVVVALPAAEPVAAKPALTAPMAKPAVAQETSALGQLSAEEKWVFEPRTDRTDPFYDPFYDREALLLALKRAKDTGESPGGDHGPGPGPGPGGGEGVAGAVESGKRAIQRVEALSSLRKWDDALNECDKGLKGLQRFADKAEIIPLIESLKRIRIQVEDAKLYEEAQARFDALGLKIEGILWSPSGSLAVISGEPRARALNDRVKDCVIINIDTNRVDFLFFYLRRRYEFQRYVGEDVIPGPKVPR